MLKVRVLGELALELDGQPIEPPISRRARSLLGLLAVERRGHARSELAACFWPEVLDESARTSLRSALSALRKALGPEAERYVVADRDRVGLADAPLVWTDMGEFQSLLRAGQVSEALELCRGELLEGLDDDWVFRARDEHQERLGHALARLAAEVEERGEMGEAVALTRRQVALDPLAEASQRELIRRLAAAGDRAAALSVYRRLQDRLRTELGIVPSAATRELVASLRVPEAEPDQALPSDPSAVVGAARGRSGTVSLLFTDEVSSTERLARLGDDEAARLRRAHFALLRELAASHAGQEVKNLGDGLMVAFDSAVDAVACAIAIQQAVDQEARTEAGHGLMVRIGLNVGEPVREADDYFGTPVVVAKRLCDAATGGQILAADVVRTLVGSRGGFEFRSVGVLQLKGLPDAVASSEVVWQAASDRRVPLPPAVAGADNARFVGREAALAELDSEWSASRDGRRRVVLLEGDPGIGKTRLAAELCRRAHADGATVLAGRCHEEMAVPYEPFVEALRHYVTSCPPSELAVAVGQRRTELAVLVPELDPEATLGAREGREQERVRIGEAVAAFLSSASRARPLILLLDDLQWADEASLLLMLHLIRATVTARLLVLGTFRQTELDRHGRLAHTMAELRRARELHEIRLEGLGESDVAALIAARSGVDADRAFAHAVGERTEGNPFFIEELLRHVDDPAREDLLALELPDSVKDLLLRRLGGLGEECSRALSFAAVIGTEFDVAVLEQVLGLALEDLVELLEAPLADYVLTEEPGAIGRYRFAHPLIRETLYGEISQTRRALMHRRVGEAIESRFSDGLGDRAGSLAHHFRAAGDVEKAFEYHVRAADAAERGGAIGAAFDHLTGAIAAGELLGRTAEADPVMLRLYGRRAWAGVVRGRREVARRDFDVALAGARAAGDRVLEMNLLNQMGVIFHVRDSSMSARCHEQSLAIAEALGDELGQIRALNRLSVVGANRLELRRALELGEQALALAERHSDGPSRLQALDALKLVALMLGDTERLEALTAELAAEQRRRLELWYLQWTLQESAFASIGRARWEEAATRLDEALAVGQRIGDTTGKALILTARCRLERSRGQYARALEVGEEAVAGADREGGDVWLGWSAAELARTLADLRAWPESLSLFGQALAAAEDLDARAQTFGVLGELAWTRLRTGDREGAAAAAERWDRMAASVDTPSGTAYLYAFQTYLCRARVAAASGELELAEAILDAVREPIAKAGIREAAAELYGALAACAEARGERSQAARLLAGGLEAVGENGLPATRLGLHCALARVSASSGESAPHVQAAQRLIEEIAGAVPAQALRDAFRRSAGSELDQLMSSTA